MQAPALNFTKPTPKKVNKKKNKKKPSTVKQTLCVDGIPANVVKTANL